MTNYFDSITVAAQHADSFDVPSRLLPLSITSQAAMFAGLDSDRVGSAFWD